VRFEGYKRARKCTVSTSDPSFGSTSFIPLVKVFHIAMLSNFVLKAVAVATLALSFAQAAPVETIETRAVEVCVYIP